MTKLSKIVAEHVLGWQQNNLNCWVAAHNFVHNEEFNPEQNWADCEVVLRNLTEIRNLDVTVKYDSVTKEHNVTLNYTDVGAKHISLCVAICIAAVKAESEKDLLTPMYKWAEHGLNDLLND